MRLTVGPIAELTLAARGRARRLSDLTIGIGPPVTPEKRRLLSYVTIEGANLWSQYSRSFYFSAALGARDSAGVRIVKTPATSPDQALDWAVYAVHPKLAGKKGPWTNLQVPDWQKKGDLLKTVRSVGPGIWPSVDKALSYPTRVLSDLPTMRNFYAHKAERAARSARALGRHYGITGVASPHDLLCSLPKLRSDVLVNEWLADLTAILNLMP